ncbi:filamentous hemagglutinin N-terminal domain-containing protein [Burkholderia ambifaria]|uniref:two-partner secretion domain-containing protein n=1 Tax=Burkholderia ambifaria TaxID=152480 RepID=UPI001FC801A4|nr:filamentous hemagglutinin N-terminal domain-containing protein [Burkholderia ambifaria]
MKHQQHHRPRAATPAARTTLAAALTLAMPILAAQPAFAQPGLVVDPNAANRPGITNGPNGTPIVGINAPDAAGISANRFTEYNVGPAGLVLNNSVNGTNTQLAGSIDGNARLGGRSAQVILNQVTGGNASVLAGATEVAGQQARVIVANPNGIGVNGASFINASRVSLVAGTTEFDEDGRIARFRTENGRITIDGAGLDARNLDQLDLVSRSLKVNAALHAKKLVAVAQQGTAAIENPQAMSFDASTSGELPRVAIDVSRLGSVHGEDSIVMRGTSAGVGINISGKVEALTGSVTLLSDGRVRISGGGSLRAGTLSAPSGLQYGGNWTDDDEAAKPPVEPEPPVAETKPPVEPEPPVAETKPPVEPEPPVAETKPPVEPEPPIAETNPKLVVDPNAANRPGLGAAPNGTPIVDINAADASGISSNRFLDYNVGPNGLVLNNSVNRTNTQLAGSIDGNARLGGRSAQVILNQVTGGNASVLAGATEVAGQQARVIVANPNGISVNGASFINASRASLVAGTTEFDEDGRIARFRTENGRIAIDGAGLDARNMDQLDLVSRGLKVDAAVRAKKLVAIAHQGTAAIEQSNRQTLSGSASGKAPAAAIDVSESGSLRADEIALIGASAKTGVRIAGTVDADTVDVSGRLDNDGSVRGRSVRIAGDATNSGTLHAEKLLAMGNVTNGGTIEAGDVQVMGNTTNNGTLRAEKLLAMGNVTNGSTIEAGDVQVMGNTTNNGALRAKKLFSTSGNMTNRGTIEGGDVKVMGNTTNDGTLRAEKLLSAMGNVTNRGTIEAGAVKVMGKVTNDGTLHGDDSVSVMGRLYNGLSGVTSSYGNVFGAGRVSGPGRIVSYMVRPTPAGDVR